MEYFWGSVKIMLVVYGLAALISMLVAVVIKLIFVGIRRQRVLAMAKIDATVNLSSKPAGSGPTKAV